MSNPNEIGSHSFDNLMAGCFDVATDPVVLAPNQTLKRGTVLGRLTSGLQAKPVDSTKSDGTQTPFGILLEDTVVGATAAPAPVALTGEFNGAALIFGGTDTVTTHKVALRDLSIFVKTNTPAHNA